MKRTFSGKLQKSYRTLAIIGNGFDLAHDYDTLYSSFVNATSAKSLDRFKEYCDKDEDITTWYSFEENINRLTHKLFLQSISMSEDCDCEVESQNRSRLRDVFVDIHNLLLQYLRQKTESKPVVKLPAVKKYLKRKTFAISFNYTKTAAAYACKVFYVHGSISENDILLGYDDRDEACIAGYEDMRWRKDICREALEFRRYLKNNLHLSPDSAEYNEKVADLENYYSYENSGRGIDEEVKPLIQHYQCLNEFLNNYRKQNGIPDIDYSKISTLAVLGHGIEADQVFLTRIVKKCTHLRKVVIFRYAGESDDSFNAKAHFFRPYCKRIRSIMYK